MSDLEKALEKCQGEALAISERENWEKDSQNYRAVLSYIRKGCYDCTHLDKQFCPDYTVLGDYLR